MSNGIDIAKIVEIEGLMSEIQARLAGLSNTNPIQLNLKVIASETLGHWERNELFELRQAFEEVVTS